MLVSLCVATPTLDQIGFLKDVAKNIGALGEFGATIVVAGNIPGQTQTLPLAIFTYLQTGDDFSALRLMVVSVVLSLVALVLHRQMNRKVWL